MGDSLPIIDYQNYAMATEYLLNFEAPFPDSELMLRLSSEDPRGDVLDTLGDAGGLASLHIDSPDTLCDHAGFDSLSFPTPSLPPITPLPRPGQTFDPANGLCALPSLPFGASDDEFDYEPQPSPLAAGDTNSRAFSTPLHYSLEMEDQCLIEDDTFAPGVAMPTNTDTDKEVPEEDINIIDDSETSTDSEVAVSNGKDEKIPVEVPLQTLVDVATAAVRRSSTPVPIEIEEEIPTVQVTPDSTSRRNGGKRRFAATRAVELIREQIVQDRKSPPATARDLARRRVYGSRSKAARYADTAFSTHLVLTKRQQEEADKEEDEHAKQVEVEAEVEAEVQSESDSESSDDEPVEIKAFDRGVQTRQQQQQAQEPAEAKLPPLPMSGFSVKRTGPLTTAIYHDEAAFRAQVEARHSHHKKTAVFMLAQQTKSVCSPTMIVPRIYQEHVIQPHKTFGSIYVRAPRFRA